MRTSRQIVDSCKIEPGTLTDFQQRLQTLIDEDIFKLYFNFEKLCFLDEVQRCFTESRFGPSHIYPKRFLELSDIYTNISNENPKHDPIVALIFTLGISPEVLFSPNKYETIAYTNDFYKLLAENCSKPPAQLKLEGIDTDVQISHIVNNNIFLRIFMPSISHLNISPWRNKIDAESTLLIIAIVRYKQYTGNYPESLDKLKEQGYIKQIPIDPFSDKPITYHKTDNNFLLYSWGSNLKDDDGQIAHDEKGKLIRFAETGDWVFWPVEKN